ncbi:MoaD/ThiS family protein [Nocardioides cavernaquae]|uniref:MoaD/ThiS family protein n=1 Tax=Nocardioides cavernaquae TaxID=2321396 RepID=A0A3A5H6W7_9ACTN|nr:MoaD/ThiS family protein [Nocardioides cavernaquae]RJS46409.1 MoaD/ThiS family protein [Nocardioides cavernaquae]
MTISSPVAADGAAPHHVDDEPVVVIRYWAAAKEAAGTHEELYVAGSLAEALAQAHARHSQDPRYARVLGVCSLLVDGHQVGSRDRTAIALTNGSTVEVLPPFAGG